MNDDMGSFVDLAGTECPLCGSLVGGGEGLICGGCHGRLRANFFLLCGPCGLLREVEGRSRSGKRSTGEEAFPRGPRGCRQPVGSEIVHRRNLLELNVRLWGAKISSHSPVPRLQGSVGVLAQYIFDFVERNPAWTHIPELAISLEYWVALSLLILDPASRGRYLGPCLADTGKYRCQEPLYGMADHNLAFCLSCESCWNISDHEDRVRDEVLDVLVTVPEAVAVLDAIGSDSSFVEKIYNSLELDDLHPITGEPMYVLRKIMDAHAYSRILYDMRIRR